MNYFFSLNTVDSLLSSNSGLKKIILLGGKSSQIKHKILKSIAIKAESNGFLCLKFLSKFDYDKLCAVYIKSKAVLIIDKDLVTFDISSFEVFEIDSDLAFERIEYSEKINNLFDKKRLFLNEAAKYENSAANMQRENAKIFSQFASKAKVLNYVLRFLQRNSIKQSEKIGKENILTLSNITPWGIHTCYESIMENCTTVFLIADCTKSVSSVLVDAFSSAFCQCGINVEKFSCSLCSEFSEHIYIPELSLAFLTENEFHSYPYSDTGIIGMKRFLNSSLPKPYIEKVKTNMDICNSFVDDAVFSLYDAMGIDNEINNLLYEYENSEALEKVIKETELLSLG